MREQIADTILSKARRKGFTVQHTDGAFQLVGPKVDVEYLAEQVAGLDKPEANAQEPSKNDTDDRVYQLQIHLDDIGREYRRRSL